MPACVDPCVVVYYAVLCIDLLLCVLFGFDMCVSQCVYVCLLCLCVRVRDEKTESECLGPALSVRAWADLPTFLFGPGLSKQRPASVCLKETAGCTSDSKAVDLLRVQVHCHWRLGRRTHPGQCKQHLHRQRGQDQRQRQGRLRTHGTTL